MSYQNQENLQSAADLNDIIRNQLNEADGVATQELTEQALVFSTQTAESMSEAVFDTNEQGSMSQELVAVADTGKSIFAFVRTSTIEADGSNPQTRIALTEMPHASEQSGRLVHVFAPGSETYAGIQPLDQGKRSRMQAMVDGENNLHVRLDPEMQRSVERSSIDGNPVAFSYAFGPVIETPPQDWAVDLAEMQAVAQAQQQTYQYQ